MQSRLMEPIEPWLDLQYRRAGEAMLRSISPVGIVKTRPGFGQTMRPLRGSIVASPGAGLLRSGPDYFFHWYRDSAVVHRCAAPAASGTAAWAPGADASRATSCDFSLSLCGARRPQRWSRRLAGVPRWRPISSSSCAPMRISPRSTARPSPAKPASIPDGTLDISSWARPQHDGPALRALALAALDAARRGAAASRAGCSWRHWCAPIWTSRPALARAVVRHLGGGERAALLHAVRVGSGARATGADWLRTQDQQADLAALRAEAQAIRSAYSMISGRASRLLSLAVVVSSGRRQSNARNSTSPSCWPRSTPAASGEHSARDPRLQATLARLESLFDAAYAINSGRPASAALPWVATLGMSTIPAVRIISRRWVRPSSASGPRRGPARPAAGSARRCLSGTVRAYIPSENGDMSEQFDQRTGAQTSARQLAWSYACFHLLRRRACAPSPAWR